MFCPKCGVEYDGNFCPNGCNSPQKQEQTVKRKKLKGWQIALIVVSAVVVVGIVGNAINQSENTDAPPAAGDTASAGAQGEEVTADVSSEETSSMTYEEEISTYQTVDYATLARNPDSFKDQKFVMTGEVIQVQEPTFGNTVQLRVNVTKQTYEYIDSVTWTDTVYATVQIPEGENRILEGDIITFYGVCDGLYSYTSVLGSSVSLPKIDIKYWNLSE